MIISVSGKINSGKDTVGKIIQYLQYRETFNVTIPITQKNFEIFSNSLAHQDQVWKIKKFADKLKDIVCLLIGCTREQLEDREFKEKELGKEWWYYKIQGHYTCDFQLLSYLDFKNSRPKHELIKATPRLLLQLIGTDCGRGIIHPNIWINALMNEYKKVKVERPLCEKGLNMPKGELCCLPGLCREEMKTQNFKYPNWVITDMRFPNELKAVKDRGGITIRVNRRQMKLQNAYMKIDTTSGNHPSETALDNAEFDYIIDNNSDIQSLIEKVKDILIKEKII